MKDYIAYFSTVAKFEAEKSNLPKPNVVYVEENDELLYNVSSGVYEPLRIWVDDFPAGCECLSEIDEFIADPDDKGANGYDSMNQTINIDGVDYCMWECSNGECDSVPYLLTTTYDYDELYSQSLEDNTSNNFTSYYSMINTDNETYNVLDSGQKLVKVIKL